MANKRASWTVWLWFRRATDWTEYATVSTTSAAHFSAREIAKQIVGRFADWPAVTKMLKPTSAGRPTTHPTGWPTL